MEEELKKQYQTELRQIAEGVFKSKAERKRENIWAALDKFSSTVPGSFKMNQGKVQHSGPWGWREPVEPGEGPKAPKLDEDFTDLLANGPTNKKVIALLTKANDARIGAKIGRWKPFYSKMVELSDAEFYSKSEEAIVAGVVKILKKRHRKAPDPRKAVEEDFRNLAQQAGYYGPQPDLRLDY